MPHFNHLICPVCRQGFTLTDKSVRCPQGHTFDLARQGYLNLHLSPVKTKYTKDLYLARQHLFQSGVFDPLISCLCALLLRHRGTTSHETGAYRGTDRHTRLHSLFLLDAGCGDGSLLASVTRALSENNHTSAGLGIDLCKDAIKIASRTYPSLTWCVADLARPPIADSTQDIILNILAPANYAEFKRLLKPGGALIKVLPGPNHFQEIRQALASQESQQSSSQDSQTSQRKTHNRQHITSPASVNPAPNNPTHPFHLRPTNAPQSMAHAHPHFTITETQRLTYDVPAAHTIEHFIHMSPLSWHTLPEKKESALSGRLQKIRLDYIIALAQIFRVP